MKSDHRAILSRRQIFQPGLFSVRFQAPELSASIRPGQFVMVEVPGRIQPYLRRAYSVADRDAREGEVELLVKTIGRGTAALEEIPEGSRLQLLGPLGNTFSYGDLPAGSRTAIVAGGIGAAPFPLLLKALAAAGLSCDLYLGGRSAKDLAFRERFEGVVPGETLFVTDDGSLGERGLVTRAFERRLDAGKRYVRVFACGPMPMFTALAKVVTRAALSAEFSTEAEMGCGFGACLGCVLPGTEKPFLVSCSEGPILRPEKIRW